MRVYPMAKYGDFTGGASSQFWYATPPPSLLSGPTSLPRANIYRPYIWRGAKGARDKFLSFLLSTWHPSLPRCWSVDGRYPPFAHVARLLAQALEGRVRVTELVEPVLVL